MGVPALFSLIARKYSKVLRVFDSSKLNVHNLYFDSNSIIYDFVHANPIDADEDNISYETKVIEGVCKKLEEYVKKAYRSFYLRPRVFYQLLKQVRTIDDIKRITLAGARILDFALFGE